MKIKRLYIGDMGIYRNALMENISPNIVVVGGLNRSGKTTLLEVLRHLPYGFPKNLRDTRGDYFVEGDFVDENGDFLTIKIDGLREPQVSSANGRSIDFKDLYGNIDKFTYSKLYTITLDELKKSGVKEEEEKIKAILLGAGLNEIALIPKIVEGFKKEKEKIGGKNGSPATKLFKPHYEKLLQGIEEREQALKQIDDYKEKCQKAYSIEKQIKELSLEQTNNQDSLKLMEALKASFNYYEEKKLIEAELTEFKDYELLVKFQDYPSIDKVKLLSEEYAEVYNRYTEAKNQLERNLEDPSIYKRLIDNRDNIRSFEKNSSGLKQRLENYFSHKKQYDIDRENLIVKLDDLNSDFKGDLVNILNINCDFVEEQKLLKLIDDIKEQDEYQKRIQWEEDNLNSEKQRITNELNNSKSSNLERSTKSYLIISLAIILAGIVLYIFNKTIGGALVLLGTTAAFASSFMKGTSDNVQVGMNKTLKKELSSIEDKIENCNHRVNDSQITIDMLLEELGVYKKKLKLNRQISPAAFYQYYKNFKELRSSIVKLGYSGKNLDSMKKDVKAELLEIITLVGNIYGISLNSEETIFILQDKLFKLMETAISNLENAEELFESSEKLNSTARKALDTLNIHCKEDEISNALDILIKEYQTYNEYKAKESKIGVINNIINANLKCFSKAGKDEGNNYDYLFKSYTSYEDLARSCSIIDALLKNQSLAIDELKEERQKLKVEIKNLSTSEKLQDAQKAIISSRGELQNLAVKYAVYSATEYLLDKIQKKFIDNAKDTLLSGASSIFSAITSGEYNLIVPGENLLGSDFGTATNGQLQESTDILSRGTGEQLFLSVRLNRIKESNPKLPVVLDDSFVNFDSTHTKNTLMILSEISKTNQIFIFTCHPEVVRLISQTCEKVQYWRLQKGAFQPSDAAELSGYLGEKAGEVNGI